MKTKKRIIKPNKKKIDFNSRRHRKIMQKLQEKVDLMRKDRIIDKSKMHEEFD